MSLFLLIVRDIIILMKTLYLHSLNTDFYFSNQFSCSGTKTFFPLFFFFLFDKQSLLSLKLKLLSSVSLFRKRFKAVPLEFCMSCWQTRCYRKIAPRLNEICWIAFAIANIFISSWKRFRIALCSVLQGNPRIQSKKITFASAVSVLIFPSLQTNKQKKRNWKQNRAKSSTSNQTKSSNF